MQCLLGSDWKVEDYRFHFRWENLRFFGVQPSTSYLLNNHVLYNSAEANFLFFECFFPHGGQNDTKNTLQIQQSGYGSFRQNQFTLTE